MGKSVQYDTEIIGAFPVIAEYLKKLGVARIIKELVPWEGNIPLGTLAEILILNRMLNPKALMRVGEWAQKAGVTEYYGVTADQLNDDLFGRALERLSEYRSEVEVALVLASVREFDLLSGSRMPFRSETRTERRHGPPHSEARALMPRPLICGLAKAVSDPIVRRQTFPSPCLVHNGRDQPH